MIRYILFFSFLLVISAKLFDSNSFLLHEENNSIVIQDKYNNDIYGDIKKSCFSTYKFYPNNDNIYLFGKMDIRKNNDYQIINNNKTIFTIKYGYFDVVIFEKIVASIMIYDEDSRLVAYCLKDEINDKGITIRDFYNRIVSVITNKTDFCEINILNCNFEHNQILSSYLSTHYMDLEEECPFDEVLKFNGTILFLLLLLAFLGMICKS